jgi:hypothetical protein
LNAACEDHGVLARRKRRISILSASPCSFIAGVGEEQHGMAFGTLATANGVGDFLSSVTAGAWWHLT